MKARSARGGLAAEDMTMGIRLWRKRYVREEDGTGGIGVVLGCAGWWCSYSFFGHFAVTISQESAARELSSSSKDTGNSIRS